MEKLVQFDPESVERKMPVPPAKICVPCTAKAEIERPAGGESNVSFTPVEGAGRAASGLTDGNGYYSLSSYGINDGAEPGKYRVAIIARGPDRPPKAGETGSGMPGEMMPGEPIIPQKYFAPDSSGIAFEIKRGRNRANFDLTD